MSLINALVAVGKAVPSFTAALRQHAKEINEAGDAVARYTAAAQERYKMEQRYTGGMNVEIKMNSPETLDVIGFGGQTIQQVVTQQGTVDITMTEVSIKQAMEVMQRLAGMDGWPVDAVEQEIEEKLPALSAHFARRIDV